MKKPLFILACAALALPAAADEAADTAFVFTDQVVLPHTAVKDQNKSGTCWCFSGTSFFEDEILRQGGDSVHISEMYTVRHTYGDKADRYVRNYGQVNFTPGGSCPDVAYIWQRYGAMPEEVYNGLQYGEDKHNHGELDAVLTAYVNAVKDKKNGKITPVWKKGFEAVMDAYFGQVPETFTYKGKTYTPQSYFNSLGLNLDDYVGVTSFTHHPWYESFVLEIPDNWIMGSYHNVPMDEMKAIVDNAIANGYPVAWAADVSEKGFKWYDGVALMPKEKNGADLTGSELARWVKLSDSDRANDAYNFKGPVEEVTVTQESRQEMFDNQLTTDDHGMEIIGIATDQLGNRYYKVKNSWDTNQVYDGYIYVSEPYFLAKTMNVYVNRNAIPKGIAKKMGL